MKNIMIHVEKYNAQDTQWETLKKYGKSSGHVADSEARNLSRANPTHLYRIGFPTNGLDYVAFVGGRGTRVLFGGWTDGTDNYNALGIVEYSPQRGQFYEVLRQLVQQTTQKAQGQAINPYEIHVERWYGDYLYLSVQYTTQEWNRRIDFLTPSQLTNYKPVRTRLNLTWNADTGKLMTDGDRGMAWARGTFWTVARRILGNDASYMAYPFVDMPPRPAFDFREDRRMTLAEFQSGLIYDGNPTTHTGKGWVFSLPQPYTKHSERGGITVVKAATISEVIKYVMREGWTIIDYEPVTLRASYIGNELLEVHVDPPKNNGELRRAWSFTFQGKEYVAFTPGQLYYLLERDGIHVDLSPDEPKTE